MLWGKCYHFPFLVFLNNHTPPNFVCSCFFPSVFLSDWIVQIYFTVFVHSILRYWCCPGFHRTFPVYFGFKCLYTLLLFYLSSNLTLGAHFFSVVTLLSTLGLVVVVVFGSVSARFVTLGILVASVLNIWLGWLGWNSVVLGVGAVGNSGSFLGVCG